MSRSRGTNMTLFEDEALCRAYIQISLDSVSGANQTSERLWAAIASKYHEQPGISTARTPCSLQSRYSTISKCVTIYISKLSHAMSNQGSGTNEVDWIKQARESYQIEMNKAFVFDRCYQILKEHRKYDLNTTSLNTQRSRYDPTDSGGSFSVNLSNDSSPIDIECPDENRHTGRNQAKLQKKKKEKEKSLTVQNASLERAIKFLKLYESNLALQNAEQKSMHEKMERLVFCREEERERNNREEERRNRDEEMRIQDEERRIREDQRLVREEQIRDAAEEATLMGMDLNRMTDQQRELYDYRIQELLNRRHQQSQASQKISRNFPHY